MNIGIFVGFLRPHQSGVVVSVETRAKHLQAAGHKVTIFTPKVKGYKDKGDLPVVRLPSIKVDSTKAFAQLWRWRSCCEKVKELEINRILVESCCPIGFMGVWIARTLGIPCFGVFHTNIEYYADYYLPRWLPRRVKSAIKNRVIPWVLRYVYNRCQKVIAPSEEARRILLNNGILPEKILVLPTPIDIPGGLPTKERARLNYGYPLDAKIIICVCRIGPEKNLKMLIGALSIIALSKKDFVLVLVGDGDYCDEVRRLINCVPDLMHKVSITGFIDHEEVFRRLVAGDVFAFPSTSEIQGIVVQEAMGVGLPVVVTTGGGASEAIVSGLNGLVVPNSVEHFAKGILRFLDDPDFATKCGQNAIRTIKTQYDSKVIIERLINELETATSSAN